MVVLVSKSIAVAKSQSLLFSPCLTKDSEIRAKFAKVDTGEISYIDATLDKDSTSTKAEALLEVYRRLRPGDLATVENARSMIERTFFDYKRYDYSAVGRFKINQRLGFNTPNDSDHRTLQKKTLSLSLVKLFASTILVSQPMTSTH